MSHLFPLHSCIKPRPLSFSSSSFLRPSILLTIITPSYSSSFSTSNYLRPSTLSIPIFFIYVLPHFSIYSLPLFHYLYIPSFIPFSTAYLPPILRSLPFQHILLTKHYSMLFFHSYSLFTLIILLLLFFSAFCLFNKLTLSTPRHSSAPLFYLP